MGDLMSFNEGDMMGIKYDKMRYVTSQSWITRVINHT
jgi:hypothetical protein